MPRELSSDEVAHLLQSIGITFKRHGKEDIYEGYFRGKVRTVIMPRNKKSIPKGTLASIFPAIWNHEKRGGKAAGRGED
jgi:predicted RNA binding protein YcfA (HicA-like mRNA interferase family)